MAGFTPISSVSTEADLELPISTLTLSVGDMLDLAIGATTWTEASATTEHWQLKAVCSQAATTAESFVKARLVSSTGQLWEAETANNSSASHNGDRMLLTDKNTVNNTGTDNTSEEACFIQISPIGAAADKRVLGIIVPGIGINADAS